MITPKSNHHHYQPISQRNPEVVENQYFEVKQSALSRAFASLSFAGTALKIAKASDLGDQADAGAKLFAVVLSGRAVISGQAREDLKKDLFSADASERAKFWTAASSYLAPISTAAQVMTTEYKDRALNAAVHIGHFSEFLKPLTDVVKSERAGASAITAFQALKKMSKKAPTREKVVTQAGLIEASAGVAKLGVAALGYPEISLGLALISNFAGAVKAFAKPEGFTPYQSEWQKEFLRIKSEANDLIENQFKQAIHQLKSRKDLSKEQRDQCIAGLEISQRANKKAIEEAPDDEVLFRSLLYFEIESHSLFLKQLFEDWKSNKILNLSDRCTKLNQQKMEAVDQKVQGLIAQKEHLEILDQQLDEAFNDIKAHYKHGHPTREFMTEEINSMKAILKEEQDKIESILQEKELYIDTQTLPLFEAHELTEDLSKRYNVNDWIDRADALQSPERRIYLDKKTEHAIEEPTMMDILHL